MRRGTTPEYLITIPGKNLTGMTVEVDITQGCAMITKAGDELSMSGTSSGTTIAFRLTQEETLAMKPGKARVQVRFINSQGIAEATSIGQINVDPILRDGRIEYEGGVS